MNTVLLDVENLAFVELPAQFNMHHIFNNRVLPAGPMGRACFVRCAGRNGAELDLHIVVRREGGWH